MDLHSQGYVQPSRTGAAGFWVHDASFPMPARRAGIQWETTALPGIGTARVGKPDISSTSNFRMELHYALKPFIRSLHLAGFETMLGGFEQDSGTWRSEAVSVLEQVSHVYGRYPGSAQTLGNSEG